MPRSLEKEDGDKCGEKVRDSQRQWLGSFPESWHQRELASGIAYSLTFSLALQPQPTVAHL